MLTLSPHYLAKLLAVGLVLESFFGLGAPPSSCHRGAVTGGGADGTKATPLTVCDWVA